METLQQYIYDNGYNILSQPKSSPGKFQFAEDENGAPIIISIEVSKTDIEPAIPDAIWLDNIIVTPEELLDSLLGSNPDKNLKDVYHAAIDRAVKDVGAYNPKPFLARVYVQPQPSEEEDFKNAGERPIL